MLSRPEAELSNAEILAQWLEVSVRRGYRQADEALEAFISVLDQHTVEDMMSGRPKLPGLNPDEELPKNGRKRSNRSEQRQASN